MNLNILQSNPNKPGGGDHPIQKIGWNAILERLNSSWYKNKPRNWNCHFNYRMENYSQGTN